MKVPVRVICVICLMLFMSCGGGSDGPRQLKLSLILGENSDWYQGAERFGELLEERTGGSWSVRIYPHAQLAGQVQRAVVSPPNPPAPQPILPASRCEPQSSKETGP